MLKVGPCPSDIVAEAPGQRGETMITISTYCPTCGEISLTPDDIELRSGPDAFYIFGCPQCQQRVRNHADDRVIRLLESAGVTCLAGAFQPSMEGPAFTYDDLLDLHDLLATDDWFAALLGLEQKD